ncbi:hypothetical protein G7Y79_00146g102160 [Physcia stellaris]|nr:hypothetical protein G7Y79_00146g102160 [Physcia stellaris]
MKNMHIFSGGIAMLLGEDVVEHFDDDITFSEAVGRGSRQLQKPRSPPPFLLLLLSSIVQASPVPTPNDLARRKPSFPSLDDCKAKFTAPPKDKSLYFTGLKARKDVNKAKKYAEDHGLVHVSQSYPAQFTDPGQYDGTDAERRAFQENFSRLYAEGTTGDAYLMLDDGKSPAADSIFQTVEFPAMRDGAKVAKILQFPFSESAG